MLNWDSISEEEHLSEEFIREFKENLNWKSISSLIMLTESFIVEMKAYVDWNIVFSLQNISYSFIVEHITLLNMKELLMMNDHLRGKLTHEQWENLFTYLSYKS